MRTDAFQVKRLIAGEANRFLIRFHCLQRREGEIELQSQSQLQILNSVKDNKRL